MSKTSAKTNMVKVFSSGERFARLKIKLPIGNVPAQLAITADESTLFVSAYDTGEIYTSRPIR